MAAVERRFSTGGEKYEEDALDPRVQVELETLNKFSIEINALELELDEARSCFRQTLTDSSQKLNALSKKLGSCIEKARPYYEARMKSKEYQTETQMAALRFERACSQQAAAKEMVHLAEEGFFKKGQPFDPAWQEMLNHATMKVNEAEQERLESELEHQQTALTFSEAEQRVKQLQKELKRVITKSSLSTRRSLLQLNNLANQQRVQLLPYFEMKAKFNQFMEEQKKKVSELEQNVVDSKGCYSQALRNLEQISDEIHQQRRESKARQELGCRGSGVGAESPSPPPPQIEAQARMPFTCQVGAVGGTRKQLNVSSQPDLHSKKSRSLPRDIEFSSLHQGLEFDEDLEDEYAQLPSRLETPEGLPGHTERELIPSFKTLPKTYSPRGKVVARAADYKNESRDNKSRSETSSVSDVDSVLDENNKTGSSSSPPRVKSQASGPTSPVPIVQLSPSETETRTLDYFSDADSECQRTNAEIMDDLRKAKSIARAFLRPNKSLDSLDDMSDVESVSESLSSVAMLDDEQVECLMMDTAEFTTVLTADKKPANRADSLPARLSYLDEYLPIKVNWVKGDDQDDSAHNSEEESQCSSNVVSPNESQQANIAQNITIVTKVDSGIVSQVADSVSRAAGSEKASSSHCNLVANVTQEKTMDNAKTTNKEQSELHVNEAADLKDVQVHVDNDTASKTHSDCKDKTCYQENAKSSQVADEKNQV